MSNYTVECDTCLHNSTHSYRALLTTSFFAMVPADCWNLWSMRTSSHFLTQKMDLLKCGLLLNDVVLGLSVSVVALGLDLFQLNARHLWGLCIGLMTVGRPLIQCIICLERYLAVLHPHTFLRYRPVRYRAAILALVLLLVSACCCAGITLCVSSNPEVNSLTRFVAMELLLFLAVDTFCCLSILWVLHRPAVGEGGKERSVMKKKALKTVTAIQVTMLLCYMPPISGAAIYYLTEDQNYCMVYTLGVFSILIASSLQSLYNIWPDIKACVSRVGTALRVKVELCVSHWRPLVV